MVIWRWIPWRRSVSQRRPFGKHSRHDGQCRLSTTAARRTVGRKMSGRASVATLRRRPVRSPRARYYPRSPFTTIACRRRRRVPAGRPRMRTDTRTWPTGPAAIKCDRSRIFVDTLPFPGACCTSGRSPRGVWDGPGRTVRHGHRALTRRGIHTQPRRSGRETNGNTTTNEIMETTQSSRQTSVRTEPPLTRRVGDSSDIRCCGKEEGRVGVREEGGGAEEGTTEKAQRKEKAGNARSPTTHAAINHD